MHDSEVEKIKAMKLPDSLSELTRLALADLEAVEADDRYTVNMMVWHQPCEDLEERRTCHVCLAGAVLAREAKLEPTSFFFDLDIYPGPSNPLDALDEIRRGDVMMALVCFLGLDEETAEQRLEIHQLPTFIPICDYQTDPEGFKQDLAALALRLEKVGL